MRLSDFDFDLPEELIAQTPLEKRDASRLMVIHRERGTIDHRHMTDLPEYLHSGDLLVTNDTQVVPCRLLGNRVGHTGKVELLVLNPFLAKAEACEVLARPGKKLTPGTKVEVGTPPIEVKIIEETSEGRRMVRFPSDLDLGAFLKANGHVPLPPYIRRDDTEQDHSRYQTVFAAEPGAVAAPTAGLHFSEDLLQTLLSRGVDRESVTLHVGPGTFAPVNVDDTDDHEMDAEYFSLSAEVAARIVATKASGGRVVGVGTTVVRTLESAAQEGNLVESEGWTKLFIVPPYPFKVIDTLVTNFHLPKSTLLMLVAAFTGYDLMREAYAKAIEQRYRFYSYGDAMLLI